MVGQLKPWKEDTVTALISVDTVSKELLQLKNVVGEGGKEFNLRKIKIGVNFSTYQVKVV